MKHNSAELKQMARVNLSNKWGISVGITALQFLLIFGLSLCIFPFSNSTNTIGTIVYVIVTWIISILSCIFEAGAAYFYLNICRGREYRISDMFIAFKMNPDRFLIVGLIMTGITTLIQLPVTFSNSTDIGYNIIITLVCSIAASVVSVILQMHFNLANYLLLDFPEMGAIDSMRLSATLMKGNKWRYFYIFELSFIGWSALIGLSFGIGYLWIGPYIAMTQTYFYCDVLGQLETKPENHVDNIFMDEETPSPAENSNLQSEADESKTEESINNSTAATEEAVSEYTAPSAEE